MAKIKLNGDTSGYVEISAPAVSGNNTLELGPGTRILTNLDNTFTGVSTYTNGLHVTGGNIGIGENNPQNSIHISGSAPAIRFEDSGANGSAFSIIEDNNGLLKIRNDAGNSGTGSGIAFEVDAAERLRITSDGKVAIGFNAPAVAGLSLANSSTSLGFEFDTASGFAGGPTIRGYHRPSTTYKSLGITGADIKFGINDVEKLRLDSNGYLGLNNSAPHNQYYNNLVIGDGSASGDRGITIRTQSSNEGVIAFSDADSGTARYAGKIAYNHGTNAMMFFTTNGDERLRITDAGMVGINMTPSTTGNSTYMLQMYNAGSQCFMSMGQGSGNGPLNGLVMGVSSAAHYITGRENSPMIFATNDTERLRITSAGDVGIGEDSPADRLVVQKANASGDVAVRVKNDTLTDGSSSTPTTASLYLNTSTGDFNTFYIQARRYDNDTHFGYADPRSGGHTPNMIISNDGRITMPNQPCAMAYNAQGQHMAGGSVAQFNSTRFNIGSMYNSSNGRMTVPVDGRYLVAYSGLHDYISQNAIGFDIRINGSKFDGGEAYQEDQNISNSQLSKTLILHLSANDYVEIYIRTSGTQVHQRYGSFSMCLLT